MNKGMGYDTLIEGLLTSRTMTQAITETVRTVVGGAINNRNNYARYIETNSRGGTPLERSTEAPTSYPQSESALGAGITEEIYIEGCQSPKFQASVPKGRNQAQHHERRDPFNNAAGSAAIDKKKMFLDEGN